MATRRKNGFEDKLNKLINQRVAEFSSGLAKEVEELTKKHIAASFNIETVDNYMERRTEEVKVAKKPRKTRSDKGKKRNSKTLEPSEALDPKPEPVDEEPELPPAALAA